MEKPSQCPYCQKRFADDNGRYSHMKMKHPMMKRAHLRPAKDDEESFADLARQAEIDEAMGVYNFDQEWLLP